MATKEIVLSVRLSKEDNDTLARITRHFGAQKGSIARRAMQRGLRLMEDQLSRIDAENRKAIIEDLMQELEPKLDELVQKAVGKVVPTTKKKKVLKKKSSSTSSKITGRRKPRST
jgi:predicted DNA-binding protein